MTHRQRIRLTSLTRGLAVAMLTTTGFACDDAADDGAAGAGGSGGAGSSANGGGPTGATGSGSSAGSGVSSTGTGSGSGAGSASSSTGGHTEGDPGCGLDTAAFCETFETASPGGRAGDLDERRFGFARWGHYESMFERPGAWTRAPLERYDRQRNDPTFCGDAFENLLIGSDVRVCPGRAVAGGTSNVLSEVFNDAGDFGLNSVMVRQPFDFIDGGVVVFDVDAKRNGHWDGHGWWIELWVTEDPSPIPYHGAPTVASYPRNGIGIQFIPRSFECPFETGTCNQAGNIFVTRDYEIIHELAGGSGVFAVEDEVPNHFEVHIATDRVDVYASNAGSTETHLVESFTGLQVGFTRGFVHFQHSHYNAFKDHGESGVWASPSQTYRWDNIGFDGPVLPPLRVYDVPDLGLVQSDQWVPGGDRSRFGYDLGDGTPITVQIEDVDLTDATRAMFNFNLMGAGGQRLRFRFNDTFEETLTIPEALGADVLLRSLLLELPIDAVVPGTNTMEFQLVDPILGVNWEGIGNMDLALEVGP